jgi:hypothetical protein
MEDTYEIEDNVPMPDKSRGTLGGVLYQTLDTLEVGQSFVVTGIEEGRRLHHATTYIHKRTDKQFTRRKLIDDRGQTINAWRVWRLK